jgi:hypothetical protein
MKMKKTLAVLAFVFAATCTAPVVAQDPAVPASADAISADAVLRQMSEKIGAAMKFSFKARREIDSELAGGDGLHGNTRIAVTVQRPDKVVASATIPGDVRQLYFDGKQLSLVDVQKHFYATVPLAASLDKLPSELAAIYGFIPPLAEFLVSDLHADLVGRVQSVEYRGTGTIKTGFLGLKRVRCHRVALTGQLADSELWIAVNDLLPRRWTATVKGAAGNVEIRLELSEWNLEAKTRDVDFVFSPGKDAIQIPMMTEAEMAAAHNAAK